MEHAQKQLAEYKQLIENECDVAQQKENDAEKIVSKLQLKLEKIVSILEQEVTSKQKLVIMKNPKKLMTNCSMHKEILMKKILN